MVICVRYTLSHFLSFQERGMLGFMQIDFEIQEKDRRSLEDIGLRTCSATSRLLMKLKMLALSISFASIFNVMISVML